MKNSLHLTTDEKMLIVDISPALCEVLGVTQKSMLGTPFDAWLGKDCMRSFLKDVLLAYRGETIENHVATIIVHGNKHHVSISIMPTFKKDDALASRLSFAFTIRQKPADCNPLFKLDSRHS